MDGSSAAHPDNAALAPEACTRCGTFDQLSTFWGKRLCAACVERQPGLFRAPVGVRGLLTGVATLPARVWLVCAALHMTASLPSMLRTLVGAPPMRGLMFDLLCASIAAALATIVGVRAGLGEDASLGPAIRKFGGRAAPWFGTTFIAGLWVLAMSLLFVVPGIVKSLSLALTTPIVLFEPLRGHASVLDQSTERMRGARWSALVAYALFLCIEMALALLVDLAIGESSTLGARGVQAVTEMLGAGLASPTTLITVVLYLRLTPPATVASVTVA